MGYTHNTCKWGVKDSVGAVLEFTDFIGIGDTDHAFLYRQDNCDIIVEDTTRLMIQSFLNGGDNCSGFYVKTPEDIPFAQFGDDYTMGDNDKSVSDFKKDKKSQNKVKHSMTTWMSNTKDIHCTFEVNVGVDICKTDLLLNEYCVGASSRTQNCGTQMIKQEAMDKTDSTEFILVMADMEKEYGDKRAYDHMKTGQILPESRRRLFEPGFFHNVVVPTLNEKRV